MLYEPVGLQKNRRVVCAAMAPGGIAAGLAEEAGSAAGLHELPFGVSREGTSVCHIHIRFYGMGYESN